MLNFIPDLMLSLSWEAVAAWLGVAWCGAMLYNIMGAFTYRTFLPLPECKEYDYESCANHRLLEKRDTKRLCLGCTAYEGTAYIWSIAWPVAMIVKWLKWIIWNPFHSVARAIATPAPKSVALVVPTDMNIP